MILNVMVILTSNDLVLYLGDFTPYLSNLILHSLAEIVAVHATQLHAVSYVHT